MRAIDQTYILTLQLAAVPLTWDGEGSSRSGAGESCACIWGLGIWTTLGSGDVGGAC